MLRTYRNCQRSCVMPPKWGYLTCARDSQSEEAEKLAALDALVEALIPQRNKDVRPLCKTSSA